MLAAADGFGWGQPRPTLPPDYRRVASIGNPRPRIMTLIDDLLFTANTPGFGSQQYRAVDAIAHAAPHAIGLMGDGSDPLLRGISLSGICRCLALSDGRR